jgi:peptidoglycan/LPS O-acetylase OafA/YrhL
MRKSELPALTGVRFLAALAVFVSHVSLIPGMETFTGGLVVFDLGVVGVSFFFVLSGFILTYNYGEVFRYGVSWGNYRRFVWDRFSKIYPVHFAALVMVLPIQILSPNLPLDWHAVPVHLLLLQCWWPSWGSYVEYLNVPSWSISCEWFFYLMAPTTMFLALGGRRRWVPVVAATLYVFGLGLFLSRDPSHHGYLYLVSWFAPSRILEFLVGVFLARFFMTSPIKELSVFSRWAQVSGFALLALGASYRPYAPWPLHGGLLYVPGSTLLVLGLAGGHGPVAAWLSRPLLNRLGLASFCLYMIQAPMLRAIKGVWLRSGWMVQSWTMLFVVAAALFVLVQCAALALHLCYEMPAQKRLRGLVRAGAHRSSGQLPQQKPA